MDTPKSVVVHLGPNRFTVGYYLIEGNELHMLGPDGEIARTCTLKPDDNPQAIASVLTKEIRKQLRQEVVEGFNDPLEFPVTNIA